MSEPTLIQTFDEIKLDVAEELGYTRTESKWSAEKTQKITDFCNAGYRRFLFSAQTPGNATPHKWSFLEPYDQITVWPTIDGTVNGVPSYDAAVYSTITATAAKFYPTMVGKTFTFDTSGTEYTIAQYISTTQIKVTGDASGETSDDTFEVVADGDYRLPDNFGNMIGGFHITGNNTVIIYIENVGVANVLNQRANITTFNYTSYYFAISPEQNDGTEGQRHKLMLYPTPNEVLVLDYQYTLLPDVLSTSKPFPRGSEQFSEAIRYACLSEVERRHQLQRGYREEFDRLLAIAIGTDQLNNMPDVVGYNSDYSVDGQQRYYDRTVGAQLTYNGIPIN